MGRNVNDTHFEPSFIELDGIHALTWWDIATMPLCGAMSSTRVSNPRFIEFSGVL